MQLNLLLAVYVGVFVAYASPGYFLGGKETRDFVDAVTDDAVKSMGLKELSQVEATPASRVLGSAGNQCETCIVINTQRLTTYFSLKIKQECLNFGGTSHYVRKFCATIGNKTHNLDQQLNGYLFQRLRIRQLSIAMCISKKLCSPANAFNSFLNPALPDILINIETYCPSISFEDYEACVEFSSKDILDFATERVKVVCGPTVVKNQDLAEFCDYFSLNENFGRGIVQAMAPVYQYSTFLCKQYSHACHCRLAGGNPFA